MYSIKKVSEMLNIPTVTIRAWENRYQLVHPVRSNGGHRLYTDQDVATLKWVKLQMGEQNIKISEAVSLLKQRVREKEQLPIEEFDGSKGLGNSAYTEIVERLYQELIQLNSEQAHYWIDLAFSKYHHHLVFHHILTPVLYRIGDEWENGRISVGQEHFSTELIMQRCSQFLRTLPTIPQLPKALALCPEGEHHQMGLMLFSLFLRNKGIDVIYTGPNTPLQDIPSLIELKNVQIVAVTVSNADIVSKLVHWVEQFTTQYPDIQLVLGGPGFYNQQLPFASHILSGEIEAWENWYQANVLFN